MSSGVGAGIMMASATAVLTEIYPAMADQIFRTGQRQRDHLRHRWHLHGDLYRHPAVQLAVRKAGAGPWPQKQQERKQNQRIISGGTNQYEIH